MTFFTDLFKKIRNRGPAAVYLSLAVPVMAAEWIVFKCLYPFADYFTDSYSYIQSAAAQDAIGYRPIGYSLFLRLVHAVWTSDTFLVTLQYAIVQGACLALFLWLVKWCGLSGRAARIVLACMLLNPSIAYLCNFVSSDALFVGLSLIWLVVLMGLFRVQSWWRLALQVILLLIIFNLRYVALFYPAIAALSFLLMRRRGTFLFKVVGILASVGVVTLCFFWIKRITYKETGANVFSAFSGWQLANNALHVYPHVPIDTVDLPSLECQALAKDVQTCFASSYVSEGPNATTEFMWLRSSPLHQYMAAYQKRYGLNYFNAWNRVAPVFNEYGNWLIRRHPMTFTRRYIWPSAQSFFLARLDVFGIYNEGNASVDPVARDWFHYSGLHVRAWSGTMEGILLAPLPWIYLLLNMVFVVATYLFWRTSRRRHPLFTGCLELVAAYLLINAVFTIFAAPTVFRYQILPMILLMVFAISLLYFSRSGTASDQ